MKDKFKTKLHISKNDHTITYCGRNNSSVRTTDNWALVQSLILDKNKQVCKSCVKNTGM